MIKAMFRFRLRKTVAVSGRYSTRAASIQGAKRLKQTMGMNCNKIKRAPVEGPFYEFKALATLLLSHLLNLSIKIKAFCEKKA
ncbi:MAG TPA: hypothetical protein PLZ78_10685, partial [Spirochaetota bacterium]|nr:hypothetical protein [Spirochaetota bacterium]